MKPDINQLGLYIFIDIIISIVDNNEESHRLRKTIIS